MLGGAVVRYRNFVEQLISNSVSNPSKHVLNSSVLVIDLLIILANHSTVSLS